MTKSKFPRRGMTRRRMFGIVGAAALAGAAVMGAHAPASAQPAAADDEVTVMHGAWPYELPPSGTFNIAPGIIGAIDLGAGLWRHMIFPPGALYKWAEQDWLYLIAESHEFTEDEFVYNVREDLTWSDGSPLTAQDVVTTFVVRWMANQPEWAAVNSVEAVDDHTVVFGLDEPSLVLERYILQNAWIISHAVYGEWADAAKELLDAGEAYDSDAVGEIWEELREWAPDDLAAEVLVSGPFIYDFDTLTDSQITLNKNPNGLFADDVLFDELVIYNGETDDITPLVLDGTIDYATHGFPVATQQAWEADEGVRTVRPGVYSGLSLLFSRSRNPEFEDVRVRQAFAHAIDKASAAVFSLDESAQVPPSMAGFSENLVPQWLDDETLGQLNPYEYDLDRAAELLEEAGWTLNDDGRWETPDGDVAEYAITFQSNFADWPPSVEFIAQTLTEFGITLTLDGIESFNMQERVDDGTFDIATMSWGIGHPHPHFSFVQNFVTNNYPMAGVRTGGPGMDYALEREVEGFGEVDIQALIDESAAGMDEDAQRALVNELALIFNAELPVVPVWERFGNNPANEGPRVAAFPDDDDPIWENGAYQDNPIAILLYEGLLEPAS